MGVASLLSHSGRSRTVRPLVPSSSQIESALRFPLVKPCAMARSTASSTLCAKRPERQQQLLHTITQVRSVTPQMLFVFVCPRASCSSFDCSCCETHANGGELLLWILSLASLPMFRAFTLLQTVSSLIVSCAIAATLSLLLICSHAIESDHTPHQHAFGNYYHGAQNLP